jgi:RNA polymerase sigma-70 factor (ECF subfamily)
MMTHTASSPDAYLKWVYQAQSATPELRRLAFDELVRQFQPMVYRQAYAWLGDSFLAQDVAQETFITAYLQIQHLRSATAFPAWLRRIVWTHCDRSSRGKSKALSLDGEQLEYSAYSDPSDDAWIFASTDEQEQPEAALQVQERVWRVRAAIDALPEHERAVTEGFYLQGESQKELAERLHVPVDTVKKRLQYARQRLRGFLSELNDAVDKALADMLQAPAPQAQRQPVYIYRQNRPPSPDAD